MAGGDHQQGLKKAGVTGIAVVMEMLSGGLFMENVKMVRTVSFLFLFFVLFPCVVQYITCSYFLLHLLSFASFTAPLCSVDRPLPTSSFRMVRN